MSIKEVLTKHKVIGVVGFSVNPSRASNRIAQYLMHKNYTVYGINPNIKEKVITGIACYSSLKDVPDKIEIVNVFRKPEFVIDLIQDILELGYKPEVVWTQFGVMNQSAKKLAESHGLEYIENKCIMIEHQNITV